MVEMFDDSCSRGFEIGRNLRARRLSFPLVALAFVAPVGALQQTATQPTTPPPKGIQWQTGDYAWKLGGYLKVDLIHDFDEIGSTDSFDVRTIPTVETADGDATRIHAR
jgi:hypothetical protein